MYTTANTCLAVVNTIRKDIHPSVSDNAPICWVYSLKVTQ